jgi:hypothetical protein
MNMDVAGYVIGLGVVARLSVDGPLFMLYER